MYYILIDGIFRGFLASLFKIGPDIIESIILDVEEAENISRKQEILEPAEFVYDPEISLVKRYSENWL
jgi:hypothetical protein